MCARSTKVQNHRLHIGTMFTTFALRFHTKAYSCEVVKIKLTSNQKKNE